MVVRMFVMGALLVFPIMFIQYAFEVEGVAQDPILKSFFLAGGLEEFFKWFIFLYVIYKNAVFDAHYDGIVYGVSISLGFATVENVLYLLANGIDIAFLRAIFPVSSHALFGVIMGYYIGKAKFFRKKQPYQLIVTALFIPILLHGSYDYVLTALNQYWAYILTPFMVCLWFYALRKVKLANQVPRPYLVPTNKDQKEA